ncbi:ABC transporter substrate-binding protein [Halalkalicoccus sp. NIPERK01]|uniref:ABC transporter substrate-binding protein n=1 Tax=Halalkalicoccus sp. NIPERK01 TaxID=3053469 RepID=UPI00256EC529|nr:ABC transporter substrate-binding protein [Halalkalicoccus sp. NIPERK01]MDL5361862.1 ABC transporter substrate-binding protein [Halalkalicoccus sp. NIPERK01]
MNVVSTSPSGTEILCALGVDPVAVSHACDYPPRVRDLPSIDFSRVRGESSAERHDRVRTVSAEGTVYRLDVETLRNVEPDLILSQEVCGVCAVDTTLVDEVLVGLDSDPDVVGLHAGRLEDLFSCIERVGRAVGREERAGELNAELRERLAGIEARTEGRERPRVAVFEWLDPLIAAGNWVPELVGIAGGEYGLAEPGDRTVEVGWDDVIGYDPEVLVAAPCGFDTEGTLARRDELTGREGWDELSAVASNRAYAMDGASYLNRWSPRLVDATERLAACCHPDVFGEPPADVAALS